jgi:hypothetical protein
MVAKRPLARQATGAAAMTLSGITGTGPALSSIRTVPKAIRW